MVMTSPPSGFQPGRACQMTLLLTSGC